VGGGAAEFGATASRPWLGDAAARFEYVRSRAQAGVRAAASAAELARSVMCDEAGEPFASLIRRRARASIRVRGAQ